MEAPRSCRPASGMILLSRQLTADPRALLCDRNGDPPMTYRRWRPPQSVLLLGLLVFLCCPGARPDEPRPAGVTAEVRAVLDRITPDSLRGHLSFLASDLLQGRDTPSPGLEIAAEYIAAQFRRA